MADLTVTAANVKPVDGTTQLIKGTAGEALTAGQAVYKHKTDGKWYKLDVDDATKMSNVSTAANSIGVVMFGGAATDDLVYVATAGPINPGATVVAGTAYFGSDTAGGIRPAADNSTSDVPVYLGAALTTSRIDLAPANHKTAI